MRENCNGAIRILLDAIGQLKTLSGASGARFIPLNPFVAYSYVKRILLFGMCTQLVQLFANEVFSAARPFQNPISISFS